MAKSVKKVNGVYKIAGTNYKKIRGSRSEVMHGTAYKTTGGLTKNNLKYNKHGRIVSKSLSSRATREKRLAKSGYVTKKGVFGAFKKTGKTLKKISSRQRRTKKRSTKKRSTKKRSSKK